MPPSAVIAITTPMSAYKLTIGAFHRASSHTSVQVPPPRTQIRSHARRRLRIRDREERGPGRRKRLSALGCAGCTGTCFVDGPSSKCGSQKDSDGDGHGDDCDTCPGFKATYNANSNGLAEDAEGQARLGDACDPVPLAILGAPQYPDVTYTGNPPVLPANFNELTSVVGLRTRAFLGKKDSPTDPIGVSRKLGPP